MLSSWIDQLCLPIANIYSEKVHVAMSFQLAAMHEKQKELEYEKGKEKRHKLKQPKGKNKPCPMEPEGKNPKKHKLEKLKAKMRYILSEMYSCYEIYSLLPMFLHCLAFLVSMILGTRLQPARW